MGMGSYRIMVVDDEENILKAISRSLRVRENWELETYTRAADALRRAQTSLFDAVITDISMPEIDGMQLLLELRALQPDAVRIVLTGMVSVETLMAAINQAGAFRFIPKPWNDDEMIESIEQGLRLRDTLVENRLLAQKLREQERQLAALRESIGR